MTFCECVADGVCANVSVGGCVMRNGVVMGVCVRGWDGRM